nr:type I-E CRISPR-associated protein Cse1/CasA [Saccharothrix sp. ST-888]
MSAVTVFDLAHEPWIDCLYTDGTTRPVGLQQVFLDAASIADLALPYPAAHGALYRVLTAITYRITVLDTLARGESGEQWMRRRNRQFRHTLRAGRCEALLRRPARPLRSLPPPAPVPAGPAGCRRLQRHFRYQPAGDRRRLR